MSGEYSTGYGVKYMTPTLIAKHANIDDMKQLSTITDLDLSFKHSDEHKIEKFEHLDRCKSLKRLTVCSQSLRKMNGIQTLSNLIELDLSGNKIEQIDSIKPLKLLSKLDLSFNCIMHIPASISYLPRLIHLNISRNKVENIRDVLNLRQSSNLQKLDLNNNPIYNLGHYRPFIIYYLSQISMLDSKSISQNELIESRQRFERNEIEKLLKNLDEKDEEITSLKKNIKSLTQYKSQSQQSIEQLNDYIQQQKQSITELNTQLNTQQQLILCKNDALIKTRNELSEMEDKYHELQLSIHDDHHIEQKEESFEMELPSKLNDACAVYLDSIQSVNELMSRYNDLKQQYEVGKENMNMIHEQIVKSNKALNKLKERHNIRRSMDNPFENEEYSRILSQPPCFDMQWNVSPISKYKDEEKEEKQISISDDSIKAKIREAHQIEEDIAQIERELEIKQMERRRKQNRKSSMSSNGNRGSIGMYSSEIDESKIAKNDELVQQFATLVESLDKIEPAFSMKQRLSHSQNFDDLRIKLVKLYIKRYKNEQHNVKESVDRLQNETDNIENQLSDYISNRNALLLDIHRILRQLDTDYIDANNYPFTPKAYSDNLPESIQEKYENILHELEENKKVLQKEKNVADLLRNQIQQRQNIPKGGKLGNHSNIVHDLIVRAETAENRIEELSFVNNKLKVQNKSLIHTPHKTKDNTDNIQYSASKKGKKPLQYELDQANNKIKSMEQMLKKHESELVETLTQQLKESENECNRLKRETEEKLSFAKYLMTTKEQRLEAEKTINLTLQREIEEMKEQSEIFTTPNQYREYHSPLHHEMQSYTEPMSMNQSIDRNKRLFDSEPIQSNLSKNILNDDHEPSEHDAVRLNIDDDDDDLSSIHSTQQNIMQLSVRLSNLRNKVQSEEETIKELETKKCDLKQECQQCLEKLNDIQNDISVCKDKKEDLSTKLDQIEMEHKENKLKQQHMISTQASQDIVEELRKKSQEYANQLGRLEDNTKELLQQKEDAQKQLKDILQDIDDKQQEYNQITKRIQIKNFELSNLEGNILNKSEINDNMNDTDDDDDDDDSKQSMLNQIPTKRYEDTLNIDERLEIKKSELKQIEERLPIVCDELDSTLQQLNVIKNELRNHENYHKIIRLDAIETEIEERIKELSRLKDDINDTRNMERSLHEKIAEITQEVKGMEYQIDSKQNELNNKIVEIESMEKALNKKNMELLTMNKNYDKKNKKWIKLNGKLNEAEQLLKDISMEQTNANSKLNSLRNELYSKENELRSSMDLLQRNSQTNDAIKLFKVVERIETEQKSLSDIQTNIQKANNELKSLHDIIEKNKEQIQEFQHEIDDAKNGLELQTKQKELNETTTNELVSNINDLQRNKKGLSREIQSEQNNLNDMRKKVNLQKNELRKLKKEHHETDKQLNDKRYKLMSTEHDLSETKTQLNMLKKDYDKIKAKIRSKSKNHSPKQQHLDVELYRIYKKDESEREQKLENYNKRLVEMDELVNSKKLLLLQHQNEMDDIKNKITESNKTYREIKDESCKIQRDININKGKLSIYEKEIEHQQQSLESLYEKKRQKTVELFKEKSSEIQDANDRLQELQKQINAVLLELDEKKRILNDINEEKELNENSLDEQNHERCGLQQELLEIKQNVTQAQREYQSKTYQLHNVEKQLNEMMERMNKMKKDVTKRSAELVSDRTVELEALQCQVNKARQEIIELNRINIEKQNKQSVLNQTIANKDHELLSKEERISHIEQEMEKNNSELGEIDAKIQLKNKELTRIKHMISDFSKQRVNLIKENKENMKLNIADIEQELQDKNKLLEDCNEQIKDKENKLMIIGETLKKRSEDHQKLENEIRESSFESLRIKSEHLTKTCLEIKVKENELNNIKESLQIYQEQYQSLNKEIPKKQLEQDDLEQKLHEIKKDLSTKKRELENITLQSTKQKSQLNQIQNDLLQLNPKKESLNAMNDEMKGKENELQQININYENAENELEVITANISSSKRQYETLSTEIENVNKLREDANHGLRSTQKELQSMNQELERVKLDLELQSDQLYTSKSDRLKAVMNDLSKKSRELNDIKKKARSIKDLLSLKEKELKQITTNVQQQKLYLTQITSDHNDTQRKLKSKRNELRVITMELERKNKDINNKEVVNRNDEKYLSELSNAIRSNKQKLNELDHKILEKKKQFENINLNIDQYTNDLETLKQENNYYNEQKVAKMGQINDLTMKINTKKQELDKARLEIELKSKQIDDDVSIKMREIMNQIQIKQQELNKLNDDYDQKNMDLNSIHLNIKQNEHKLASLQSQIKEAQKSKLDNNNELKTIKQSIHQYNTTLMDKENKLKDIEQEIQLKLEQIHGLSGEFDEETERLRQSRNSLQRVNVDLDEKNNELQGIVERITSAKSQINDAQNAHLSSIGSSTLSQTPKASTSLHFGDSMNLSMLSNISSPEQARAHLQHNEEEKGKETTMLSDCLDVSLDEIKTGMNKTTTSPQIIIRTVEKLRRTIDAMCYPRGGCIFSLASSINHYNRTLDSLEQNRIKLVSILQEHSRFEVDSDDNDELKQNTTSQQQTRAVSDLGKIWEELQTVKKMINKLCLEKQHLETTLNHALNIIQNKSNSPSKSPIKSKVFASTSSFGSFSTIHSPQRQIRKHEIEESINTVLKSIESQGNVWRNTINSMDNRLKAFELKVQNIKHPNVNVNEMEMKHTLSSLEHNICDKKSQLNNIDHQLNAQRILLKQLKEQSDAIANKVNGGQFYQMSSSPTMARQIANKMRLEKELNDLKQELNEKKEELSLISQQLTDEAQQLKQQQNILFSSIDTQKSDNTQIVSKRIHEIQKLYKLREKNLKKRIDSYKKELQKRDKELNDIQNILSNTNINSKYKKMQNDVINELRSLQIERSTMINQSDLKNQIKERDEQIAFLINHFGQTSKSQSFLNEDNISESTSRSQALSQIEANLSSALAPFKQNKKKHKLSAYHFVPATSSSDSNSKRKRKSESLLTSIFGADPIEQQHRAKYQRDTVSSKKKRKQSRYKSESDDDDDDDITGNHSNFILDDHEDRYKSLNRRYG